MSEDSFSFVNTTLLAIIVSFVLMVFVYKRNPPFIQKKSRNTLLYMDPDLIKIGILGILCFLFVLFAPMVVDMAHETKILYTLGLGNFKEM